MEETLRVMVRKKIRDGPVERQAQKRQKRNPGSDTEIPTPNENLLYLLTELEQAVERPTIHWTADLATAVQHRLENLVEAVRQILIGRC